MAHFGFPYVPAAGAGLLALTACAPPQTPADGVPETTVSVTDTVCVPNEITVKAGKNRFVISNRSMRPLEWEILDGVMVVDERENIVPGLMQKLTTTLKPGTYVMTCGLLTNPRGTLIVTENADAPKTGPAPLEFVSAQAEYKVFVHERLQAMQSEIAEFAAALRAGDAARARQLYAPSRQAWQQLVPVAVLASAQYDRLEGAATLYRDGESDPDFVGWHRIEAALFDGSPDPAQLSPLADTLEADGKAFADIVGKARVGVDSLFKGAALAAQRVAERKLEGLDNPEAGTDLADAADNVVGLRKLATVFDRALGEYAPQQKAALLAGLDTLQAGLAPAATGQPLADAERQRLAAVATQLSHDFTATLEHLGL